jgi:hypothetical protein
MKMSTERIKITNTGSGMNSALNLTENFSHTMNLSEKTSSRLRLLTEEMLSMVRSITENFTAEFYIECDDDNVCKLHLEAKSDLDYRQRRDLLSVSTEGTNIASLGIMDKIRWIFEAGLVHMEDSFKLQAEFGNGYLDYGMLGSIDSGMSQAVYAWSMQKYKDSVDSQRQNESNLAALDAWDELEKSIIANIADEVQVGVTRDGAELIVTKSIV